MCTSIIRCHASFDRGPGHRVRRNQRWRRTDRSVRRCLSIDSHSAVTAASSATSRPTPRAFPSIDSATSTAFASSRSATITSRAPSAAKACALARPMPLPPPVTTQIRSFNSMTPSVDGGPDGANEDVSNAVGGLTSQHADSFPKTPTTPESIEELRNVVHLWQP